jgi:ribonuclease P protein component
LPRRARLARRADLEACWSSGHRLRARYVEIAWQPNRCGHPRFGVVVPRYQHSAVARNRVRRRLREIVRRGPLAGLSPVDVLVRARRVAYEAGHAELRMDLTAALGRIP